MLTKETKKRIDNARDTLVGVLPLPSDQIELITIGLIYKFMDDQDEELRQLGFNEQFFKGTLKDYSWQQLMSNQISADQRVTKFINGIEQIQKATEIPLLFKEIFQNAFLKFRDGKVLQRFLDLINGFTYSHSEELGNAFEYLLKTMGSQGNNGQFRTPKNIIDFMVDVVNPIKTDTILDPACGTGGFLVSSFKHLLRTNTKGFENTRFTRNGIDEEKIYQNLGDKLSTDERKNIEKNIAGYDNTPLMVRLARVNLYLHHFNNPKIHEYNTLNTDTRWKDRYDCILANPPFMTPAGGIDPHDKFRIPANRTEILFSSYILQHLNAEKGKAGFIIPEGIIFTTSGDYVALRKWLLYEAGLWAVVSLPAGVFQPYSGVKTSILFIDKEVARSRTEVLMLKIENDGFSLNTNRNEIKDNDLPEALNWLELCKINKEEFVKQLEAKNADAFTKKIQFLHRYEFAKLDAYKSSSLAFNFCTKQYENSVKNYELRMNNYATETNEKKKQTEKEKAEKILNDFYKTLTIDFLPANKEALKTWFDANIKENAIDFGVNLTNDKLPVAIKDYIENQRDFNLSFEKFTNNEELKVDNYEMVKIADISTRVTKGSTPTTYGYSFENKGINFIKIESIKENGNYIQDKFAYISDECNLTFNRSQLKENDILFSIAGALGRVSIVTKDILPANTNQAIAIITLKENINTKYVYLILKSGKIKSEIENLKVGVAQLNLSLTQISNFEIPLPPLETQQKIVDEIDQYQKVIDGCNLLIENYKPSFEIKEDWDFIRMSDLATYVRGPFGGSLKKEIFVEDGYLVYEQSHAIQNDMKIGRYFIDEEKFQEMIRFEVKPNDILMSCSGTFGKVTLIPKNARKGIINQALLKITPKDKIVRPLFLKLLLETSNFQTQIMQGVSGVAIKNVASVDDIKNIEIQLPTLQIQDELIAEYEAEQSTLNGAIHLKSKMELKIKEVIDKVW